MNNRIVDLLHLPDEILLIIFNKLGSFDVLYSLLNSTQRIDQIARSIDYTKSINFSIELSNGQFAAIDSDKLHRFCVELLPQIHHQIQSLTLETSSIKRIILAAQFPNLHTIVLVGFSPDVLLHYLTSHSIAHLFKEQIQSVTVKIRNEVFNNKSYEDVCECILSICEKCTCLDMNQAGLITYSKISFNNDSRKMFYSSYLRTLSLYVKTFEDCLCLLDGRLKNLSSLTVRVYVIEKLPTVTDSQKKLPNLKEFSLTCCRFTLTYDCRILRLLRRMINLKKLRLSFNAIRFTMIDGIHLNEKILRYLSNLHTFVFDICTILPRSQTKSFLSTKDLEKTFAHWKYCPVSCSVDRFSTGMTFCHIYSIPYRMPHFMYLTNSIRNQNRYFQFVVTLIVYDTRPFEHDFFEWISKAVPRLKFLTLENFIPQVEKSENDSVQNKPCSTISYNQLVRLRFINEHIDYVYQFLLHTKAYVPQLDTLEIQYDKLVTVTNNFTNHATKVNCSQLKQLEFEESIVYPEHFHGYFPSLFVNSNVR